MGVNRSFQLFIVRLIFGVGLTASFDPNFKTFLFVHSLIVRVPPIGRSSFHLSGINSRSLNCSLTAQISVHAIQTVKLSVLLVDGAKVSKDSVKITNSVTGQNIPTQFINETTFDFMKPESGLPTFEIFIPFQLFLPTPDPSITLTSHSFSLTTPHGFSYGTNNTFIIGRHLNQKYRIVSDTERTETETDSNPGDNTSLVWEHYKMDSDDYLYNYRLTVSEFSEHSLQIGEPGNGKNVTLLMEKSLHQKTLPLSSWLLQNTAETAEALIHYYEGIFNTPMPMAGSEIFLLFSNYRMDAVFVNNYTVIYLARSDLSLETRTVLENSIAFRMSEYLLDPWIRNFTNSIRMESWHSRNMCEGLKSYISFDWAYKYLQSGKNTTWSQLAKNYLENILFSRSYIFRALELMLSRNLVQDALKPLLHAGATQNAKKCEQTDLLKALDAQVLKQNAQVLLPEGKILPSEIVERFQVNSLFETGEIRVNSLESLSNDSQLSVCIYNTKGKNFWLPIEIYFVTGTGNDSRGNMISTKLWVNPQQGCYTVLMPEPESLRFLTVSCGDGCPVEIGYLTNILTRMMPHAESLSTDQKLELMSYQDYTITSPKLRTDPSDTINALELTKLVKASDAIRMCTPLVVHLIEKVINQITFAQDNEYKLVLDYFSPLMESAVTSSGGIETILNSEFLKICVMLQVPVCTDYVANFVKLWVTDQNDTVFHKLGTNRNIEFWKCAAVRLEEAGNEVWNFFYEDFLKIVQDPVNNSYKVKEYLRILRCTKHDQQFLKLLRIVLDLDFQEQFGSITNTAALFQYRRKLDKPDLYSLNEAKIENVLSFAENNLSRGDSGTTNLHEFMLIAETILSEDTGLFHCRVGSSEWKIWFNRFQKVLEKNKTGKRLNLEDFRNSTCDDDELKWWHNNKNATLEWLHQNTILAASNTENSTVPNSQYQHYFYYAILVFLVVCFIVMLLAMFWKRRASSEDNYLRMWVVG